MDKLILVDVDGVLNPGRPSPDHETFQFQVAQGSFRVYLNPAQGQWLIDLAAETDAQLVWCTMWEHHAANLIAPVLGLPEMPFVKIERFKLSSWVSHDKAFSALNYAKDAKFAYFDDEYDIGECMDNFSEEGHNGLHVYVDPVDGLQPHHIAIAKRYLLS